MNRFLQDPPSTGEPEHSLEPQRPPVADWVVRDQTDRLERTDRLRTTATGFGVLAASVALLLLMARTMLWLSASESPLVGIVAFGMLTTLVALVASSGIQRIKTQRLNRPRSLWRTASPDSVPEWNVTVSIVQSHVTTGCDSGKLWIEDNAICFVGRRTSFALSADQLSGPSAVSYRNVSFPPLRHNISIKLAPFDLASNWRVEVSPREAKKLGPLVVALTKVAMSYRPSDHLGQFPPMKIGPGRSTRVGLVLSLLAYIAASYTLASWLLLVLADTFHRIFLNDAPVHLSREGFNPLLLVVWLLVFRGLSQVTIKALWNFRRVMGR